MTTGTKPFLTLTANDLMNRDVVTLPQALSLRTAARWLSQAQVSGAPVVDGEGRCVGVLSATDFVKWVEHGGEPIRGCDEPEANFYHGWEVFEELDLPSDEVRNYRTLDPVTASPNARITALARMMLDAHIHRVVVVNEHRRPVGLVSATDILTAVAHTAPGARAGEPVETVWPVAN